MQDRVSAWWAWALLHGLPFRGLLQRTHALFPEEVLVRCVFIVGSHVLGVEPARQAGAEVTCGWLKEVRELEGGWVRGGVSSGSH